MKQAKLYWELKLKKSLGFPFIETFGFYNKKTIPPWLRMYEKKCNQRE